VLAANRSDGSPTPIEDNREVREQMDKKSAENKFPIVCYECPKRNKCEYFRHGEFPYDCSQPRQVKATERKCLKSPDGRHALVDVYRWPASRVRWPVSNASKVTVCRFCEEVIDRVPT